MLSLIHHLKQYDFNINSINIFMKILTVLTTIAALLYVCLTIEATSLTKQRQNAFPLIVQYIPKFQISANDLQTLLSNQFHSLKLGDLKTSYVHILNSTVSLAHYGSEKRVENINPLKVKVTNDTFTVFVMFSARVLHVVGGKNYTCNTSIPLVYVNYTKEINLQTGNIIISNLASSYSSNSFQIPVCKETQSAKDKVRIDQAVNSTQGTSIYIQLLKEFSKMQEYFTANAKTEHLSKIYDTNPYVYTHQNVFNISVDVSTIEASKLGDEGVQNKMAGTIAGTTKKGVEPPQYVDGYTSFYSIEFLQNIVEYTTNNYPKWKSIKLNRQNMRTSIFKFRLIDFQTIIPSVLQKYPQKYLNDIEVQCGAQTAKQFIISAKEMVQNIDWRCTGSFESTPGKRQIFLNFVASVKHTIQIRAQQTYLVVYVKDVEINNIKFDTVGDYKIVDSQTFTSYATQGLFQFHVYTVGTFFKVNSPNKLINVEVDRGIWVG